MSDLLEFLPTVAILTISDSVGWHGIARDGMESHDIVWDGVEQLEDGNHRITWTAWTSYA